MMHGIIALLLMLCLLPGLAAAAQVEPVSLYSALRWHEWREQYREQATGNPAALREYGPLIGVGLVVPIDLLPAPRANGGTLIFRGSGELFGGQVRYDGHLQNHDGTLTPYTTDVVYVGAQGAADLGWRFRQKDFILEPFAGLGVRWWLRSLQGTGGYDEDWLSLGSRLGGRLGWNLSNGASFALSGGGLLPFYVSNSVDGATLRPDGKWSGFGELSYITGRIEQSLFYEGLRYGTSPTVRVIPTLGLLQPPSQSDIYGYRLGYRF